ncbi:MAG: class I SAM-dependent methyltransferase [Candidatus Omnitrophota bacterium]
MNGNVPCPLCKEAAPFSPRYVLHDKTVHWCRFCGCFYIKFFPGKSGLAHAGRDAASAFQEKYFASFYALRAKSFARALEMLKVLSRQGKLLDLGTGLGFFLEQARSAGWQAEGLEFSEERAAYAQNRLGFPIHVGTVEEASLREGTYDVVTLWDVLEHLPNPKQTLLRIRALLVPGGCLVIRTPVCDSLLPWLVRTLYRVSFGKFRFGLEKLFEEHLFHFSEKGLSRLLSSCGFRLLRSYREDYIDPNALRQKDWVRNGLVRLGVGVIIGFSHWIRRQDEVVVYAESA